MINLVSLSENTILVLFEQTMDDRIFDKVMSSVKKIEQHLDPVITDIIPSYASIHISFNMTVIAHGTFKQRLLTVLTTATEPAMVSNAQHILHIPVYYGREVAWDIELIAATAKISIDEVIEIHSSQTYTVYAIGFAPGFAYLGNVDQRIALPRKESPRHKIAAGSLGIADQQTAIYPSESPGGWQIIGRTPSTLVDYSSENIARLTPFESGQKVKFSPIGKEEFIALGGSLSCP